MKKNSTLTRSTPSDTTGKTNTTSNPNGAHLATLVGIVVDSVHLTPLASATVLLDGTTLSTTTDGDGKFRIDSIPPGSYRIAVFHPLLDTLGFSIGTPLLRMGADSVQQVVLATPSPQTVVGQMCEPGKMRLGPGAVIGHVLDPETQAPLAGVRVSVVWKKLEVGQDVGVRYMPQMRQATTDSSGQFVLCGLQQGINGTIQADRGETKTAEVPLEMGAHDLLAFETLHMSNVAATDSGPITGNAVLTGRIVGKNGAPVPGANVHVLGTQTSAASGPDGSFSLAHLPSGTKSVSIRRVGFGETLVAVELTSKKPAHIDVMLNDPPQLAAVQVQGKMDSILKSNGFTDRRRMGMGKYLGPQDIARLQPQYFSSLFQMIPGFKLVAGPGGTNSIKSNRSSNGCMTYWVDGVQWRENQPGELDNLLRPEQLMALEVYSSSEAPEQFQAAGQTDCSVVVVWTNRNVPQNNQK